HTPCGRVAARQIQAASQGEEGRPPPRKGVRRPSLRARAVAVVVPDLGAVRRAAAEYVEATLRRREAVARIDARPADLAVRLDIEHLVDRRGLTHRQDERLCV